jgi:adenine-specific DNA-methyltransferase
MGLLNRVEDRRLQTVGLLKPSAQATLGQYFTPAPIARFMAGLFDLPSEPTTLLDPGAGIGILDAAVASRWAEERSQLPLHIHAFEVDSGLMAGLEATLTECADAARPTSWQVESVDFIEWASEQLLGAGLFASPPVYDMVIMNPPYGKLGTDSRQRALLRGIGIDAANLYTAFLALAAKLLAEEGQLVAITPRSFCNGPYFKKFRRAFLSEMTLRRVHVFESRTASFKDDQVLQENVILHVVKNATRNRVIVSQSDSHADEFMLLRSSPYEQVVNPNDSEQFIHLVPDASGVLISEAMSRIGGPLSKIGIEVATGPVVDFRVRESLRDEHGRDDAPLLYPAHMKAGRVVWPALPIRKPNALARDEQTSSLLFPGGHYVLVKRFTSKEERRRVVASVLEPSDVPGGSVGFENHLNVFHSGGQGLERNLAWGLAAYLNSTVVDLYFRQFSGHTQVNATDLRLLPYPARAAIEELGRSLSDTMPRQDDVDAALARSVSSLDSSTWEIDVVAAQKKIAEAMEVLRALDLPRAQLNERTALTLLALLDLEPQKQWSDASAPLRGITQMMGFFREQYGKDYAPNTRETVRRQSVHQLLAAGVIRMNMDRPDRPVNSGKTTYQIEPSALDVLRAFGGPEWDSNLDKYKASTQSLRERWAAEREMTRIPVTLPGGASTTLSAGGQNILIKEVIEHFCSRYTPGGRVLYVGDADEKFAIFSEEELGDLGVIIPEHGKMPDLVILDTSRGWLVVIEAVTSHGPINPKRLEELRELFAEASLPLVFVTTFLTRREMARFVEDISWETDVWVAESPSHLIHFNGERFLGPE